MDQEVTVTESFYPSFSPLTFFTVMGGALGLFLGFSFLTLWDLAEAVLGVINKYMK